jgi:hypothetical protein
MTRSIQDAFLRMWVCGLLLASGSGIGAQTKALPEKPTQDKPSIVVEAFSAASSVPWPYDMKLLQTETMAELKAKEGQKFNVSVETPTEGSAPFYRLQGEVVEWHPGNRAKRMMVGMGSGREEAKIHYWLISRTGMKVFEHTDVIRAEFWGNAYAGSVGELAHPFADKIAKRLGEAKLE